MSKKQKIKVVEEKIIINNAGDKCREEYTKRLKNNGFEVGVEDNIIYIYIKEYESTDATKKQVLNNISNIMKDYGKSYGIKSNKRKQME